MLYFIANSQNLKLILDADAEFEVIPVQYEPKVLN